MRAITDSRIRKSTKYIYIIISIALIIVPIIDIINKLSTGSNLGSTSEQIYIYTNKFLYNYNVNLVENEFTEGMDLSNSELTYITDLIDNIELKMNYIYNADKKTDLVYTYEIIGRTQAIYTKDGEEQKIIEKDETLLDSNSNSINSDEITINEDIKLNLKQKNALLNKLKQTTGINFVAKYSVILKVNVKTIADGKEIEANYSPVISIDLAEKTTQINGNNNQLDKEYISRQIPNKNGSYTIILDAIILIIAVWLLRYATKARVTNRITNEYKRELNRLLKLCQDKIVRIKTKPESKDNIVLVRDFGEIVKLSEELFKPILCWTDDTQDEAWFSVVSNNTDYRYILKK